jgi:hypothetical protein
MSARVSTVECTTLLEGSPAMVFAVVNSPDTAHLIDPAVRRWEAQARPIGVGTRFAIRGRLGVVPIRGQSEVVIWDPPVLVEYRSVTPTWPFRMTARHSFVPGPSGGTSYTWSISFYEVSGIARPLVALATRLFDRALKAQAVALDRYLDGVPPDAPLPLL